MRASRGPWRWACVARNLLSALGSEDQGSSPGGSLLLPKATRPGHLRRISRECLKLTCKPSSLATCICRLFQTCPNHPISEWLHHLPSCKHWRPGHLPPYPPLGNCQVLSL